MKTNTQKTRVNASELSVFDKKVISLAKKNGLQLQRVRYRYGFNVWRIYYENALDRDFIAAVFSRLRGADIHLHQAHVQLVHALDRGNVERCTTADDTVAKALDRHTAIRAANLVLMPEEAGDDQGSIRRSDLIAGHKFNENEDNQNSYRDHP